MTASTKAEITSSWMIKGSRLVYDRENNKVNSKGLSFAARLKSWIAGKGASLWYGTHDQQQENINTKKMFIETLNASYDLPVVVEALRAGNVKNPEAWQDKPTPLSGRKVAAILGRAAGIEMKNKISKDNLNKYLIGDQLKSLDAIKGELDFIRMNGGSFVELAEKSDFIRDYIQCSKNLDFGKDVNFCCKEIVALHDKISRHFNDSLLLKSAPLCKSRISRISRVIMQHHLRMEGEIKKYFGNNDGLYRDLVQRAANNKLFDVDENPGHSLADDRQLSPGNLPDSDSLVYKAYLACAKKFGYDIRGGVKRDYYFAILCEKLFNELENYKSSKTKFPGKSEMSKFVDGVIDSHFSDRKNKFESRHPEICGYLSSSALRVLNLARGDAIKSPSVMPIGPALAEKVFDKFLQQNDSEVKVLKSCWDDFLELDVDVERLGNVKLSNLCSEERQYEEYLLKATTKLNNLFERMKNLNGEGLPAEVNDLNKILVEEMSRCQVKFEDMLQKIKGNAGRDD